MMALIGIAWRFFTGSLVGQLLGGALALSVAFGAGYGAGRFQGWLSGRQAAKIANLKATVAASEEARRIEAQGVQEATDAYAELAEQKLAQDKALDAARARIGELEHDLDSKPGADGDCIDRDTARRLRAIRNPR